MSLGYRPLGAMEPVACGRVRVPWEEIARVKMFFFPRQSSLENGVFGTYGRVPNETTAIPDSIERVKKMLPLRESSQTKRCMCTMPRPG